MQTIYQSSITQIGVNASEALADHMLITFCEGAPAAIADYCFMLNHGEMTGTLEPGVILELAGLRYQVTAVGEVAQQNMQQLGHITLRFDGANEAEYPGSVHVTGDAPQQVNPGSFIKFLSNS